VDSTAATNLYQLGASCDALIQVQGLYTLPDTASIFDIRELIAGDVSVNPVTNVGTIVPVLVPNNPDLPPSGSGYSLDVVSEQSTPLTVLLASRKRHGSLLDLNVFYAGGGEQLTPGGFHPGSSEISAFYKQLTSLYASAGITLGSIREYDVVGALRQELSVLETDVVLDESGNPIDISIAGLEDLFRLSAGVDDSGLNLFLVSDMGDVLGISGGIPGTLGLHGTAGSGVAIAVDVAGLADLPFVAQHELSHQMGLFHTTEMDGYAVEPLADTPICGIRNDRNGDGIVSARECRTFGGDNLMFWSSTGSKMTADQRAVLGASLILR
jgi:hypothetical protein